MSLSPENSDSDGDGDGDDSKNQSLFSNDPTVLMLRSLGCKIIRPDLIAEHSQLSSGSSESEAYWGIEPVQELSLSHLVPLIIMKKLIESDRFSITILIADIHARLGANSNNPFISSCQPQIRSVLHAIGCPMGRIRFQLGSAFQLTSRYISDLIRFMAMTPISEAETFGKNSPETVGELVYPLMQILDEEYIGADVELGNHSQHDTFVASGLYKSRLGYRNIAFIEHKGISEDISLFASLEEIETKIAGLDHNEIYDIYTYIVKQLYDVEYDPSVVREKLIELITAIQSRC